MHALLYFCGDYKLTLEQPVVQELVLDYSSSDWDTAVVAVGGNVRAAIPSGSFSYSKAGSMVYGMESHQVVLLSANVSNNSAEYGAAVWAADSARVVISSSSLSGNSASMHGGAVYAKDTSQVTLSNFSGLVNNSASYGGGVFLLGAARLGVSGADISLNVAQYGGGVAASDSSQVCAVQKTKTLFST